MENLHFIEIKGLSSHYNLELSFFNELERVGLIEIHMVAEAKCIHESYISKLEKIIRLYEELNVNAEGLDIILNLLDKMDEMQNEILRLKRKLNLYETDF